MELVGILTGLAVLLAIVTLIGHGCWLALAYFVSLALGRSNEELSNAESGLCPVCRAPRNPIGDSCVACGWTSNPETSALSIAGRQVESLSKLGLLPETVRQAVDTAIQVKRQQVATAQISSGVPPAAADVVPIPSHPVMHTGNDVIMAQLANPVRSGSPPSSDVPASNIPSPTEAVASRAKRYEERRTAAEGSPGESPFFPTTTPAAASTSVPRSNVPRRTWHELVATFMEERNMRWGEVVGGLLIISCSIALVVSFWTEIAERPILKFGVFNGVTASLFAIGIHAWRRWKLTTTSQGILLIATMLVPLNFIAIVAFTTTPSAPRWMTLGGEFMSAIIFGWLLYLAGSILTPRYSLGFLIGVLVPSVVSLVVGRHITPESSSLLVMGAAFAFTLPYLVTSCMAMPWTKSDETVDEAIAYPILKLLGVTSFSVALVAALTIVRIKAAPGLVHELAPAINLLGVPAMSVGLYLWRQSQLAWIGITGATISILGATLFVLALIVAWPSAGWIFATSLLCCFIFVYLTWRHRLAVLHFGTACAALIAYLMAAYLSQSHLAWASSSGEEIVKSLLSANTGRLLVAFVLAYVAGAIYWRVQRATHHAICYALVAMVVGAASLGLITTFGFGRVGDPEMATEVYAIYAVGAFAIAVAIAHWIPATIGMGILLAAIIQAVVFRWRADWNLLDPWAVALLTHASLGALFGLVAHYQRESFRTMFVPTFSRWSLCAVAAATAVLTAEWVSHGKEIRYVYPGLASAVLFAIAWANNSRGLFTLVQATVTATAMLGIRAGLLRSSLADQIVWSWIDPWVLQAVGVGLSILGLGWIGLRKISGQIVANPSSSSIAATSNAVDPDSNHRLPWRTNLSHLVKWHGDSFDAYVARCLVAVVAILSLYAVLPGILQELTTMQMIQSLQLKVVANDVTPRIVADFSNFEWPHLPHAHATEGSMWGLMGGVLALVTALRVEHKSPWKDSSLVVLAVSMLLVIATLWESSVAVASGLRWGVAGGAVLLAELTTRWWQSAKQEDCDNTERASQHLAAELCLSVAAILLLFLTGFVSINALHLDPVTGPSEDSLFGRLGDALSYAIPLSVVALGVTRHAIRVRSGATMLIAGLLFNCSASVAYILNVLPPTLETIEWLRLSEINSITAGIVGVVWAMVVAMHNKTTTDLGDQQALRWQSYIAAMFALMALIPSAVVLFYDPLTTIPLYNLGGIWGWSMFAVLVGVGLLQRRLTSEKPTTTVWRYCPLVCALLATCEVYRWDTGNWLAYHILLSLVFVAAAWPIAITVWTRRASPALSEISPSLRLRSTAILICVGIMLAFRSLIRDPQSPWWTCGGLAAASLLSAARGCVIVRRRSLYFAAILFNLAVSIGWLSKRNLFVAPASELSELIDFMHVNLIALALPVTVWLWAEAKFFPEKMSVVARPRRFGVHGSILLLSIGGLLLIGMWHFLISINTRGLDVHPGLSALAWGTIGLAIIVCLRDQRLVWLPLGLYAWGVACLLSITAMPDIAPHQRLWTFTMELAAYGVATSYLWSRRRGVLRFGEMLHLPLQQRTLSAQWNWLMPANCLLAVLLCVAGYWVILTFRELPFRLASAQAILAQFFTLAMLARGRRRSSLRSGALWLGVLGSVAFGWSWLNPHREVNLLNHVVTAAAALGAIAALYGIGLSKIWRRENVWTYAARAHVPYVAMLALAVVGLALLAEVAYYVTTREVVISWPALIAISATLIGLAVASLVMAIVPGRDPFEFNDRQRTIYVYAAEAFMALLFLHIRLTMPWLFSGFFLRYWPLIVMFIAYLGIGVSEWFRRRNQLIVGKPLENTGALLPLVPVIGFWISPGNVHYSTLMLTVGVLYAMLSVMRRSFLFGIVAALATNTSLWYLLNRADGLGLLEHPQLWIIPPALCILAAAYVNRSRLTESHMTTIRYLTGSATYVSSSADIFLNGVAQAPWLPFVLVGLSLVGIFAGLACRIRSFLFLGLSFLVLALFTIVWYAAVDLQQTWLWYVCGIIAGIIIISVFALFEKKRTEMLAMVEQLKHWNG